MAKKKVEIDKDITGKLFDNITILIEQSRNQVASVVNSEITILYWRVGKRYGRGWSKEQLWNCLRTAERIRSQKTIYALSKELSWTHIRTLISIKDLDERIDSLLFERTALL